MKKIEEALASSLYSDKEEILDEYIEKLRLFLKSESKDKGLPEWLLPSLRSRFSDVLDREISYLRTGQYDNSSSVDDVVHAIRVIPFCSKGPKSRKFITTLELFVGTVTNYMLSQLKAAGYTSYKHVAPFLNRLVYVAYEDLWITAVVSHRFQRSLIQKLLMKTIKVHEDEQHKLAQALHDGVLQSLATALVQTEVLERIVKGGGEASKLTGEIITLRKLIGDVTQKIRNINHILHPLNLARQGLAITVKSYLASFEKETGISARIVSLSPTGEVRWSKEVQASAYRMIQELMTNVRKHSKAKHAQVSISASNGHICVAVEDDGVGFDLSQVLANLNTAKSFGLLSIGEQANICGGSMRIQSTPGKGTRIEIDMPLDHAKV
jgi:signal transduction histidine kinase